MKQWPEIIRKAKEGGLDVIETYVFWNCHEPVRGEVCKFLYPILEVKVKGFVDDFSKLKGIAYPGSAFLFCGLSFILWANRKD